MFRLEDILKEEYRERAVGRTDSHAFAYDFLNDSKEADFYAAMFAGAEGDTPKPKLLVEAKNPQSSRNQSDRHTMSDVLAFMRQNLEEEAIVIEIGGGMHQQRSANLYSEFVNYFPLDISLSSIEQYCKKFNREGIAVDAQSLPFKDETVDCILTHTTLEHIPNPEKVLSEIARVLKVGAFVIHADAWFCRWWSRYGIVGLKPFKSMNTKEKAIHVAAQVTEFPAIRFPPVIAKRLLRETLVKNSGFKLRYKRLKPNYDLYLGCDEDAASSIDPYDVIRFYECRGFYVCPSLPFLQRVLFRNPYIIMRKS